MKAKALQEFEDSGVDCIIHGESRWNMVGRTAEILLAANGHNPLIGTLFGFLHDCKRENDHHDPYHGHRAAEFIGDHRREILALGLAGDDVDALEYAARIHHTDESPEWESIEACCLDGDRLDLGRVGITVNPELLNTHAAIDLITGGANAVETPVGSLRVLYHGSDRLDPEEDGVRVLPHNWVPAYLTEHSSVAEWYGSVNRILLATPSHLDLTDPSALIHHPVFPLLRRAQCDFRKQGITHPASGEPFDIFIALEAGELYGIDPSRRLTEELVRTLAAGMKTQTVRIHEDSQAHHHQGEAIPSWLTWETTTTVLQA